VNTLIIAFALPMDAGSARMTFEPEVVSVEAFKRGIRGLQKRGTQVLISVGGGNHPIELDSAQDTLDFVSSMKRIIDRYRFDGMDINLEGVSKVLDPGDTDFKNPTTAKILNMIEAVKSIKSHYGSEFLITVAPETQYVVTGYNKYGEGFGGYLPFLDALRDQIDIIHMQLYNSGTQFVYTGEELEKDPIVAQGSPDFIVGLTEMMILGFPVGRDKGQYFPGYGADKIAIGLPASSTSASGGSLGFEQLKQALTYLMTGVATYDTALKLRQPGGYPGLKGVMTWSINWDRVPESGRSAFEFVEGSQEILELLVPVD